MDADLEVGQVRSRSLLGTEATYRVVQVDADHVLVDVVDAPGLQAGFRMRLVAEDVRDMAVVDWRDEVERGFAELLGTSDRQAA